MKLEGFGSETLKHYKCSCDLTRELDDIMGMSNRPSQFSKHYVDVDDFSLEDRVLAIRLPGFTTGGIKLDKHTNKILDVVLGVSSLIEYPQEAYDCVKKYIGEVIEFA